MSARNSWGLTIRMEWWRSSAEREAHAERFYRSARHTTEIDLDQWLRALANERRHGARRATRRGNALPIPPRGRVPEPAAGLAPA